jgi:hypothetical protein
MTLQRLVLDYRSGELVVRCLYRSSLDAPNPGTVRRRRQVEDLVREGLRQVLASLEEDAELVGTSGFTTREDLLSVALPRPQEARRAASGGFFVVQYCKLQTSEGNMTWMYSRQ